MQTIPSRNVRETDREGDVLVAINGRPGDEDIIDFAKRLAQGYRTHWHAVHVETAGGGDRSDPAMVAEGLGLAASMGASVATIPAATVADGLARHLANSSASHLVIGRGDRPDRRWRRRGGTLDALRGRRLAAVIHLVPVAPGNTASARPNSPAPAAFLDYGIAAAAVVVTLAVAVVLNQAAGVRSLSLIFLLPVIAAAARLSLKPALLAALLSVGVYNVFFLEPAYVFKPQAVQSLVMATVLLVVAFYTSAITSTLRGRVALSDRSAQENASLASFANQLTRVSDWTTTAEAICSQVSAMLAVQTMLLREVDGSLIVVASCPPGACMQPLDQAALDWTWSSGEEAGSGTSALSAADWQFQPLKTSLGTLAVLGLARDDGRSPVSPQRKVLLSTLIAQAALAHERLLLEDRMRLNSRDDGMRSLKDGRASET